MSLACAVATSSSLAVVSLLISENGINRMGEVKGLRGLVVVYHLVEAVCKKGYDNRDSPWHSFCINRGESDDACTCQRRMSRGDA